MIGIGDAVPTVGKISMVVTCHYWLTDFDLWCKDKTAGGHEDRILPIR
jgi:hypothetical protein